MQFYHPFRKTVKGKNGKKKRVFYYWYIENGVQKQRVIKDKSVKSVYDAAVFCENLPTPAKTQKKIKSIAAEMFIFGSDHLNRRMQQGLSCTPTLVRAKRKFVEYIISDFGEKELSEINTRDIFIYLSGKQRSFGWKNQFISILRDIYQEASYLGINEPVPNFPRFKGLHKKADPLSDDELLLLFDRKNFTSERNYVLFLLMTSAGLRVSEARGFRAKQFLADSQMVLVDGEMNHDNTERNPYNKHGTSENPKWRVVLIPETTANALKNFISANNFKEDDYIFVTRGGKTLRIDSIRYSFFTALRRAGICANGRRFTIHSLRHTFVTRARSYLSADTVRQMAGHTNIDMTDYYTHRKIQDDKRNLAAYIEESNKFFEIEDD